MNEPTMLMNAKKTSKGVELGFFTSELTQAPVTTLQFTNEGELNILKPKISERLRIVTLSTSYVKADKESLNRFKGLLNIYAVEALNERTIKLVIEDPKLQEVFFKLIEDSKIEGTLKVSPKVVEVFRSEKGLNVPESYSTVGISSMYYQILKETLGGRLTVEDLKDESTQEVKGMMDGAKARLGGLMNLN